MDETSHDSLEVRRELASFSRATSLLRLLGMFLIVAGHCTLSYSNSRVPSVLWLIYEYDGSRVVDWIGILSLNVALPLFFLVSGVSAGVGHANRTAREFLKTRVRGILVPLALAAVTILPIAFAIWSYGMQVGGRHDMSPAQRILLEEQFADVNLLEWGPMHLWFLEYLFLLSVGYCGIRWLAGRVWGDGGRIASLSEKLLASPLRPVWFAIPSFLLLAVDLTSWSHLLPRSIPSIARIAYFASYFFTGVMIARLPNPASSLRPWAWGHFLLSWPFYFASFLLAYDHFREPLTGGWRWALTGCVVLSIWLALFGLFGLLVRSHGRLPASVLYLVEASFWVYLVHVPIVALAQVELSRFAMPTLFKFVFAMVFTLAASLLLYEAFVRYTRLGVLINGKAKRKSSKYLASLPRRRMVLAGVGAAALVCLGHFGRLEWTRNFHEVSKGSIYRSGQLSINQLREAIEKHGIRTVLSVRGGRPDRGWYKDQVDLCQQLGVEAHSVRLPSHQEPTKAELTELVEVLDRCPRPILIHGKTGITRPGLASAIALLLDGEKIDKVRDQFAFRFGYLYSFADKGPHRVLDQYADWLADRPNSKEAVVHWLQEEYAPGMYRAAIAPTTALAAKVGEPATLEFQVHNVSSAPWRERIDPGRGVRLAVALEASPGAIVPENAVYSPVRHGRIVPGQSRTFSVTLPPFSKPGRIRAKVDLVDELQVWFSDQGSKALWIDLDVKDAHRPQLAGSEPAISR